MTKILVIGNGFDKAHGLKTGYGDFLDWISYICTEKDVRVRNGKIKITTEQRHESGMFRKDNPNEFDECVMARNNFWIVYFEKMRDNLGSKWLDFESEIEVFTKQIYKEYRMESRIQLIRKSERIMSVIGLK